MAELDRMIAECAELRAFYVGRRNAGNRGAGIEALAVAIRERALKDAKRAVSSTGVSPGKVAEDTK